MLAPRTLQAKLLVSVFLIVTLTVSMLTALVIFVENRRSQQAELERIYYKAQSMKTRLGHLMYGKNWRYLMMTLSNAQKSDPSMLYFAITDNEGKVLISDAEGIVGQERFGLTRVVDPHKPLFERGAPVGQTQGQGEFKIYLSRLSQNTRHIDKGDGKKDELIFDAVYDIFYLGEPMGRFRAGFSRRYIKEHLWVLTGGMLGIGVVVLMVILVMIFWVIRRHMKPVEAFVGQLSMVGQTRDGQSIRERLSTIPLKIIKKDSVEVSQLKQAFENIRDLFASNWDQLENHQVTLEKMVEERTAALHQSNEKLNRQIRERKEIETRLLTVQKLEAIGTLAGGIAHEFNNLFMAITGNATLIQKRTPPGHPNIEKAEKIRELVDTGSQSIQQLLGFARSGKYGPGPLSLNGILRTNLTMFLRSRKSLDVETEYCKDLWAVHADRSQMEQVIMNLLLNASEAMPDTGTLTVETRNVVLKNFRVALEKKVTGRFVFCSVRDEGPGIDKAILPRIFDPFFTTKEMGIGSGMGLASVFGIMENHGGFITVESKKDAGSLFCIYLPALAEAVNHSSTTG